MPRYRKTIRSGDVIEIEEYFSPRAISKDYPRGANENLTPEEQKKVNERQARKKLARLINTNFGKEDLFITLTHAYRLDYDTAKAELNKYLRRVKRWRTKQGLPELKYVAVTEHKAKREHHHVIMSGMDLTAAVELWQQGRVMISRLDPAGEYKGLANYITKEPPEERRRRWSQSRNLDKPKVTIRILKSRPRREKIPVPAGYKLVERSWYYSDFTGETQYIRAVRPGGADYGGYGGQNPEEEETEANSG